MPKELTVEIFATGRWNGLPFTQEDLDVMVKAFNDLQEVQDVPLKFGHNEEQKMTDGQPALGWVDSVWTESGKLFAKFIDMPRIVFEAMKKKLYKNVSIELDIGVEHKGEKYPWVLTAVGLLGADIPAVKTLSDLSAYMSKEFHPDKCAKKAVVFTANSINKRSTVMSDDNDVTLLKKQVSALEAQNETLLNENMSLKQDKVELKAKFTQLEKQDEIRKVEEQRKTLFTQLEGMVKNEQIAPHVRDSYMDDFDNATDKAIVVFAVDKLAKTIESSPQYFGAQQARARDQQRRNEADKPAGEIVDERTRKFMAEHGEKDYQTAKISVLRADKDLANRYAKMED